jgi:transposase
VESPSTAPLESRPDRPGIAGDSLLCEDGGTTKQFPSSPEVRERAVQLIRGHQSEYGSQLSAICSAVGKICCPARTIRKWAQQAERDHGLRSGLRAEEQARVREIERENRGSSGPTRILGGGRRIWSRRSSGYTAAPPDLYPIP